MAPNVLLLTVDSLRSDHVGADDLTPSLDERAASGVAFDRAYANGFSTPVSFPSILTGTFADHYGGWDYMSPRRPFLAEAFQDAGHVTAAFHSNPHLRAETNYDSGFDYYNDFDEAAGELSRLRYLISRTIDNNSLLYRVLKRIYHLFRKQSGSADYARAPEMNDRVVRWLDDSWDDSAPFFVWNHYMDVHYPFYPPEEFVDPEDTAEGAISTSRSIRLNDLMHGNPDSLSEADVRDLNALYRGDVRYTDHHVRRLLDRLDERGLLDETIVVVTSDHGELFGEQSLFGHPPSVYDESVHVPLLLFGPGVVEGRVVDRPVDLGSLPPTLAELADVPPRDSWARPSLAGSIEGVVEPSSADPIVVGDVRILGAQRDRHRLIWWRTVDCPTDPSREWELRDLEANERVEAEDHLDLVADLRSALEAYLHDAESTDESLPEPETDADVEDRLRALGYK